MTTFALLSALLLPLPPAPAWGPPHVTVPASAPRAYQSGEASWYGYEPTAWGDSMAGLTAAHRTLPRGTRVLVVAQVPPFREAIVRIVDRGPRAIRRPGHKVRVIDLSPDARAAIMPDRGLVDVVLYLVGR